GRKCRLVGEDPVPHFPELSLLPRCFRADRGRKAGSFPYAFRSCPRSPRGGVAHRDVQAQLPRLLDAFRKQSTGTFALRAADGRGAPTREEFQATTALQRELDRSSLKLQDLAQATLELAGRLGPSNSDSPQTLAEVLKPPAPPSVTTASPAAT